jgi:hypothetical protein
MNKLETVAFQSLCDAAREAVGRYYDQLGKRNASRNIGMIWFGLLIEMRDALAILEPGVVPLNVRHGKSTLVEKTARVAAPKRGRRK